jgi:hypothetical protein
MKVINIKDTHIDLEKRVLYVVVLTLISVIISYVVSTNVQKNQIEPIKNVIQISVRAEYSEPTQVKEYPYELGVGFGEPFYTPEKVQEVKPVARVSSIDDFVKGYRGSRIDDNYLGILRESCGSEELLKRVIAMSVSESGMGRDLPHRKSNFWGWFKGGNRNYDPSREQMAKDICTGVKNYYYDMTPEKIARYTGGDRSSNWNSIYSWAMARMK